MTEEEAKTKMCCAGALYYPSGSPPTKAGTCAGSFCMAWRWVPPIPMFKEVDMNTTSLTVRPFEGPPPTHGYCGLAGKP